MRPQFHPRLVNGPFGDPALFVDFLFQRRALLFDLGDLAPLAPRQLLRVRHAFISHAHIDHFVGFDRLVRLMLCRDLRIDLYGPPGFRDRVEHRLAGYTWNLTGDFPTDFTVVVSELHPDGALHTSEFHCLRGFVREGERSEHTADGLLLDDPAFRVRGTLLDHRTPSLAFVLEESLHVNIIREQLSAAGLSVGPWLARLKLAVQRGEGDDAAISAVRADGSRETIPLVDLRPVYTVSPGQKIAYVTDAVYGEENAARIAVLAAGADLLFIEATFPDRDADRARERFHLTARQAGELARRAGARMAVPFHFSPRYQGEEDVLRLEVESARLGRDGRGQGEGDRP